MVTLDETIGKKKFTFYIIGPAPATQGYVVFELESPTRTFQSMWEARDNKDDTLNIGNPFFYGKVKSIKEILENPAKNLEKLLIPDSETLNKKPENRMCFIPQDQYLSLIKLPAIKIIELARQSTEEQFHKVKDKFEMKPINPAMKLIFPMHIYEKAEEQGRYFRAELIRTRCNDKSCFEGSSGMRVGSKGYLLGNN